PPAARLIKAPDPARQDEAAGRRWNSWTAVSASGVRPGWPAGRTKTAEARRKLATPPERRAERKSGVERTRRDVRRVFEQLRGGPSTATQGDHPAARYPAQRPCGRWVQNLSPAQATGGLDHRAGNR